MDRNNTIDETSEEHRWRLNRERQQRYKQQKRSSATILTDITNNNNERDNHLVSRRKARQQNEKITEMQLEKRKNKIKWSF